MEGSTELSKLCKEPFVAERPRRTGLRPVVTGILSSLIPINVVYFYTISQTTEDRHF
jgi:hypothetical protein